MVYAIFNADLWREIIGKPLEELVRRPESLSFYIASKMPLSETTRQELLEMNGISYRLRREIQLLRDFNHLRCKNCMVISHNTLCFSSFFSRNLAEAARISTLCFSLSLSLRKA